MYVVGLVIDGNSVATITPPQMWGHVDIPMAAMARAKHDAARIHQAIQNLELQAHEGPMATLANRLRRGRRPLDPTATYPLRFEPVIDSRTGEGMVRVSLHTATVARWSPYQVEEYVRDLLTTQQRAEDDTLFREFLVAAGGTAADVPNDEGTFHKF